HLVLTAAVLGNRPDPRRQVGDARPDAGGRADACWRIGGVAGMIAREATMATAQSPARSSRTLMRLFAVALLAGAAAGVYLAISFANQRQEAGRLFAPSFPATRLVTNEYAYHNP